MMLQLPITLDTSIITEVYYAMNVQQKNVLVTLRSQAFGSSYKSVFILDLVSAQHFEIWLLDNGFRRARPAIDGGDVSPLILGFIRKGPEEDGA